MQLAERGVRTLMVEGGASLISSFLDAGLWDVAVITVAPVVFRTGVSLDTAPDLQTVDMSRFSKPQWTQVGGDVVMLGFPK